MGEYIYSIDGSRGKHLDVYDDKIILNTKVNVSSAILGNPNAGKKQIYYSDCIGVQFKKAGLKLGYIQIETASSNSGSRFVMNYSSDENTFVWDGMKINNDYMEEVFEYIKERIDIVKHASQRSTFSPTDEIKKYKELLDMGAITPEEFEAKKKQLLEL